MAKQQPFVFSAAQRWFERVAARPLWMASALLAVLLAASLLLFVPNWSWTTDSFAQARAWLDAQGALGIVIFGIVFTLCGLLALPVAPWTVVGALVYGPILGFIVIHVSATVAAGCTFILSRRWLRPTLRRTLGNRGKLLSVSSRAEAMRLVLLLRMSPLIPFAALNYAAGLSRMRLLDFVAASAVGKIPNVALYAYSVAAAQRIWTSTPQDEVSSLAFWAGLVATALAVWQLSRAASRNLGARRTHSP